MGSFILLTVMYSVVIYMLNRVMRKLVGDFKNEIRSVNGQFFVFLISYLTRCSFVLLLNIKKVRELLGGVNAMNVSYLIVAFLVEILPTTIFL